MAASKVIVSYRDGSPGRDLRVVLGFPSGQTSPVFTGRDGKATIEHKSTGEATVYVDGKSYGTFHAPGTEAVTIQ
jgi:hypothetical protein